MRRFQEFKGQSTRLDYDRECGEFVARPVPHPFVARNAASEVQIEPIETWGSFGIVEASRLPARAGKVPSVIAPGCPLAASNYAMELTAQRDPSRDESLGYEDSVWSHAVVGLALAGIVIWAGFVVS